MALAAPLLVSGDARGGPPTPPARPRSYVKSMENGIEQPSTLRKTPPTFKEKNDAQRAVTRVLDALAPKRATTRTERNPVPIEQYRTLSGCVLQSATAALSVSWFPDAATESSLGELQIVLWNGVVARRGAATRESGAVVVRDFALRPVEHPTDSSVWRAEDGTLYDVEGLAAHCLGLLKEQMLVDDPSGAARSNGPRRRD